MLQAAALDRAETLQDFFFGARERIKKERDAGNDFSLKHKQTKQQNHESRKKS